MALIHFFDLFSKQSEDRVPSEQGNFSEKESPTFVDGFLVSPGIAALPPVYRPRDGDRMRGRVHKLRLMPYHSPEGRF
jgi:hypothetical protein